MQKLLLLIVVAFYSAIASAQSVTLTNIPALDSHGKTIQGGSLYVTWSSFPGNDGKLVPGGSKSALIQSGVFSIALTASDNAGWPYNALLMGGAAPTVYLWKIPAAGGVTSIGQISKPSTNTTASVTLSGASTTVASVAGTPNSGNCAGTWDSNGNLVPAAAPCSSGGGAGAGTTGQFAYYSSNGTAVAGHTLVAGDLPALNYQAPLGYTPLNASSNLSDVASASSARANLGLGSAATQPSSAFQLAGNYLPSANPLMAVGSCFGGYYQAGAPVAQYQAVVINASGTIQPAGTSGGGALGVTQASATSGTVGVCFQGVSQLVFDGTAGLGNIATTSTSTGGQGHDSGQTSRNSIGLQVGVLGTITSGCTGAACVGAANLEGLNRTGRQILASYLPNPSSSTLGGVQSAAAVPHQWLNAISTAGVPALSQPAFSDLSGTLAAAQLPLIPYSLGGCNSSTAWTQGSILFAGASSCSQSNNNLWFSPTALGAATTPTATVNGTPGTTLYRWTIEPVNPIGFGHGIVSPSYAGVTTGPATLGAVNNVSINVPCGSQPTGTLFEVFRSVDGSGVTRQGGPLLNTGGSIATVACPGSLVDTGLTAVSQNYLGDSSTSTPVPDTSLGVYTQNITVGSTFTIGSGVANKPVLVDIWPASTQTGQAHDEPFRLRDQNGNIVAWWQPANSIWALQGELEFSNYPGADGQQTMYMSNGSGINLGNTLHLSWSPTEFQPSVPDTNVCRGGIGIVEFGTTACNTSGKWLAASGAGAGTATFSLNANAGTGASAASCATGTPSHVCDSISGDVTYTTGTAPSAGTQFTITTGITRTAAPNCTVKFYGGTSALVEQYPAPTATTLFAGVAVAPSASTTYNVHYGCWGN